MQSRGRDKVRWVEGTDSLYGPSEHLNFQLVNTISVSSPGEWAIYRQYISQAVE